jgi:histidyl-tRNA synthetase
VSTKPNLAPPSGSRDFLPEEVAERQRVLAIVRATFARHGFQPMDTPAFERVETLTGKYGEEGEKLIFKILKRGEQAATGEADLALRYDLTVPGMRMIAANRHKLPRVFKRYAMGPVWRADRPGKGRFREFWQCDVDILGAASHLADVEVLLALAGVLDAVDFPGFEIRLNSRKVLAGMMTRYGVPAERAGAVVIAIDKLDKIGMAKLGEELDAIGLPPGVATALHRDLGAADLPDLLAERLAADPVGAAGIAEVRAIVAATQPVLPRGAVRFEPLLARGLDYYTGAIFEFFALDLRAAIAGGGRYDGLNAMFAGKPEPVCGGSLGLERILMVLAERAKTEAEPPLVYVTVWDQDGRADALSLVQDLRRGGVMAEVDLTGGALGRQLQAAHDRKARFALIRGPDERAKDLVQLKDLVSGEQRAVARDAVVSAAMRG